MKRSQLSSGQSTLKRSPVRALGMGTIMYNEWRKVVAKPYLDEHFGHTCARCGTMTDLDVDHIKNRSTHPELKFALTNIQWLCRPCHIIKTRGEQV